MVLAILLIALGTVLGFYKAADIAKREKLLHNYGDLLEWFCRQMKYRRIDTESLIKQAAENPHFVDCYPLQYTAKHWNSMQSFEEVWQDGVTKTISYVSPEEKELFSMLGEILGSNTSTEQQQALTSLVGGVRSVEIKVSEKNKKDGGLYRTLGVFGGLFGAILVL